MQRVLVVLVQSSGCRPLADSRCRPLADSRCRPLADSRQGQPVEADGRGPQSFQEERASATTPDTDDHHRGNATKMQRLAMFSLVERGKRGARAR
eukprot:11137191-Heterocapsa_arctica.AAC.1